MNISEFSQAPLPNRTYAKNEVPSFVITTNNTLQATLRIGNEVIFRGIYAPDFNGQISIDFRGLYDEYLTTLIPTIGSDEITHTEYRRLFTASFEVVVGEDTPGDNNTRSWYVANAKLKSATPFHEWGCANFLTNQPMEKTTNYEAPEWLTWWDPTKTGSYELVARFYLKTGTSIDVTVKTSSMEGVYSCNVRYSRLIRMANLLPIQMQGYYDLILMNGDEEVTRQRYIYEERSGHEKYFLFVNALGGIDTLICKGENVLAPDITHNIGRFGRQYRALDDTDDMRRWTQHIGQVPNRQRNWIYELLTAKQGAEKYDPETMEYFEIVVDSSDIAMSDFGQLAGSPFSYILNETENVVADTERPDRSLHQSVADAADAMDDLSSERTVAFEDDGQGGFETEELEIPATKVYVTDPRQVSTAGESPVFYFLNGSSTASGSFTPGVDDNPYVINKTASATIRFATQNDMMESLVINYYPETIQNV